MKAFRALRGSMVVAAAAGVLAVSGCGTANTAATVNGVRISEHDAQVAVEQVHQAQPDSTLDTPGAVESLIMAQFINQVANESGKGLADSAAAAAVPQIHNPTPTTLELVKASLAWSQLTSAEQTKAVEAAAKADITLNPRYGTFNAKRIQFEKSAPNWLTASRTATGG